MPSEDILRTRSGRNPRRFELSDHLPSTNDDERPATVLDGIEQVRAASRRFRRGDLRHEVGSSEMTHAATWTRADRQLGSGQGSSRVTVVTRSMALSNEAIAPTPVLSAHATR